MNTQATQSLETRLQQGIPDFECAGSIATRPQLNGYSVEGIQAVAHRLVEPYAPIRVHLTTV